MFTSNEACLSVDDEKQLAESMSAELASHCKERRLEGDDHVLQLDSSRAIIRPVPGMLWLRVDASDVLACIGTKMLLESAMLTHRKDAPRHVLWHSAGEEPFAAIQAIIRTGQPTSC